MIARVGTYGGNLIDGLKTVQHWQLHVDGEFIADTAQPSQAALFHRIAAVINTDHEKTLS